MRRNLLTMMAALAAGFAILAPFGTAQEAPKPGPEHKTMDPLAGTWSTKIKFWMDPAQPATETEGTMTRKWIMGGLFLQEDFEGKFFGADFKGMGLFGYDTNKKKYVGTWIDSMDTGIAQMEGTYDAKAKSFQMTSDDIDPMTGKKIKGRSVINIVNNDHHMQEMFRTPEGGKESKVMEIHYSRVKK